MKLNTFRPFKPFNRLAVSPSLSQQLASLFAKYPAAQGAWYDPSDLSTLFQDSAGTVPVTAVGQPVGLQRDKSGRGNHRHQPTTASRPILRQDSGGRYYLEADGVDDCLYTQSSVNFSGSYDITICMGLENYRTSRVAVFMELSANYTLNNGTFSLFAPPGSAEEVFWSSKGTINVSVREALLRDSRSVITTQSSIPSKLCSMRKNGVTIASSTADQGSGSYGNYPIYFFRRGNSSLNFQGGDYGTLILGKTLSTEEISVFEGWVASKSGVLL